MVGIKVKEKNITSYLKFWINPFIKNLYLLKEGQIYLYLKKSWRIILLITGIFLLYYYNTLQGFIIRILLFFIGFTLARNYAWKKYKKERKNGK